MTRNNVILWVGRILTIIFTAAIVIDIAADGIMSQEIRQVTIGIVGALFLMWAVWQARIAKQYEGWPLTLPVPFRWVFAVWLGSFTLFIAWVLVISEVEWLATPYRSAFVWWQFGASSLWVAGRWVTVDETHAAGVGETGTGTSNGTGGTA